MVAKESIRKKNTRGYGHDDMWQVPTQMLHDHKFRGMILSSPTAFFEQGDLPLPLFGFHAVRSIIAFMTCVSSGFRV